MQIGIPGATALRVGEEAVYYEGPMKVRHPAIGGALRQAQERPFDISRGGLAFRSAIQPLDECIVCLEILIQ